MSLFHEVLNRVLTTRTTGNYGIPFQFDDRLNKYLTGIKQAKYYAVSGRSSTGKRSFVDLHFVMNTFIWWANIPEGQRPKVKILYFNMDKTQDIKIQKWLTTFMYIYYEKIIDIPTLMNWPGKLYDLNAETLQQIQQAQGFFDLMFETGFVTMYNGRTNPIGIKANIATYFSGIGGLYHENHETRFEYEETYEKQITLIIIDNVKKLKTESKQGQYYNERELNQKLSGYLSDVKEIYQATPIVIVPAEDIGGHDSRAPSIKEFGNYYNDVDVALHLNNPSRYHNQSGYYGNYVISDFRDTTGIHRLRICSILKNAEGRDSTWIPLSFFPENGYIYATPDASEPHYEEHIKFLKRIKSSLNDTEHATSTAN